MRLRKIILLSLSAILLYCGSAAGEADGEKAAQAGSLEIFRHADLFSSRLKDSLYDLAHARLTKVQRHSMAASMSGTIKRLVSDKGFGFILAGDGNEYFFHSSACVSARFDSLSEVQNVTFDVGQGPKGPRAENVRLV